MKNSKTILLKKIGHQVFSARFGNAEDRVGGGKVKSRQRFFWTKYNSGVWKEEEIDMMKLK